MSGSANSPPSDLAPEPRRLSRRQSWRWRTDLCAKSTAYDRFRAWVEAGVFLKLWYAGVEQFDELQGIDWSWLSMDGAMTKAPLGGERRGEIRLTVARGASSAACSRMDMASRLDWRLMVPIGMT
jgi:hypothetical protein